MVEDFKFTMWLMGKPAHIQKLARAHPPGTWWYLETDPQPYTALYQPSGYAEDGTLQLTRFGIGTGQAMWKVFGVPPRNLRRARGTLAEIREKLLPEDIEAISRINLDAVARVQAKLRDQQQGPRR